MICTLGNFATKLLTGQPTGITRVHGRPQERELGGLHGPALPALPPGRRAAHAGVKELLREDIHRLPELIAAHAPEAAEAELAERGRAPERGRDDSDPEPDRRLSSA